jgi:hypothetical protein
MSTITCLLCASNAVADLLCVPCGAKLWAANVWIDDPARGYRFVKRRERGERPPANPEHQTRREAFGAITNLYQARTFKAEYDAATATHNAKTKEFDRKDSECSDK